MSTDTEFKAPISAEIWDMKYRLRAPDGTPVDTCLEDTFTRVARASAGNEKGGRKKKERWATRYYDAISDFGFIPAGRILAGAGAHRDTTLFNCFVSGPVGDDLGDIFDSLKQAARTMQTGGGIGIDFSTLRPAGALVKSIGAGAAGPVSFMGVWDAMCQTIESAGARRGAMMATMRADHPDIEAFIGAKSEAGKLTNFNVSVLVPDAFMSAVANNQSWDLAFAGKVDKTVGARDLWDRLMRATYDYAEPGVIFIDRVNAQNNLAYCETIYATNPCGEQPLPPFGACLLGSINLAQLVTNPFTSSAEVNLAKVEERVRVAVRFLDNLIDVSNYPLKQQKKEALAKRRMGIGVTGLADALIMCGLGYGTDSGVKQAATWMAAIQNAAYAASAELAAIKGTFPYYDEASILASPNVKRLAPDVRRAIKREGLRNGCLTSIAPTGTISLLAGNVSGGIEPVFDFIHERAVTQPDGTRVRQRVKDFALTCFNHKNGPDAPRPDTFVKAADLTPRQHLAMQAALQPFVDSAISKTINCPQDLAFEDFQNIYTQAHRFGLKGATTYRPSPVRGAVLTSIEEQTPREAVDVATNVETGTPSDVSTTVVYMADPLQRSSQLKGITYKLKWPQSDHAIYVTINDIVHDGRRRPFEIFINTRNLEHYSWTVALTRMISAVFRRGGDVSFVAEELKAVFDPQGGSWMDGRYVPSLLAAIGDVIETHMSAIGFSQPTDQDTDEVDSHVAQLPRSQAAGGSEATSQTTTSTSMSTPGSIPARQDTHALSSPPRARICPRCSTGHLVRRESCWECRQCNFSRCE